MGDVLTGPCLLLAVFFHAGSDEFSSPFFSRKTLLQYFNNFVPELLRYMVVAVYSNG